MSARVSTRGLVAHHLRAHAGGDAVVALLVFVLALLGTAAPIALALLGDATVRDRLDGLAATQTDVAGGSIGLPEFALSTAPTTDEVWATFLDELGDIRASAEPPLPDLLDVPTAVAVTEAVPVVEDPSTRELAAAFSPGYEDHIEILDGRLPEPSGFTPSEGESAALRLELVLSAPTAEEMSWQVGESRTVQSGIGTVECVLVGVFAPVDETGDFWQHVPSVLTPNIFDDGNTARVVTGTGFAHPASLSVAYALAPRQFTDAWFALHGEAISADDAAQTVAALRKLTAVAHPITAEEGYGISSMTFDAPITTEIETALAQQTATAGVLAMLAAGPVGVAAAVLVLGCRLILESRRASLRLLSARGASAGQLRTLVGIEGVLAGVVPAALGAAVAIIAGMLFFGAAVTASVLVPAAIVGLAPVVILAALAPAAAERQARADVGRRSTRLRLIGEGVVAGLAAAAVVLLFVRGYSGGVDVLLAATPLLLALVACVVTLRLYPLPLRALFFRARREHGLTAFLGSARALREPSIGLTPVLALVVGLSVAVSSGVLLATLQRGAAEASRAQVGADLRIAGGLFAGDALAQVRGVEGVAAATGISGADPVTLQMGAESRGTSVFVVDAAALRDVQGEGPGMLPPGVSLEPEPSASMPIVASGATADDIREALGSQDGAFTVDGVDARIVGVTRGPVPMGARTAWVAIDAAYAEEVLRIDPTDRTLLVRLDPEADPAAVEAEVRELLGANLRIDTAADVAARVEAGPAVQGVRAMLLASVGVAALLSALAVVLTLALAAPARARVLALLRTLGAPPGVARSLTLWEIAPPAISAVIAGTVFGALVPLVVMAAVDLRPFTGSSIPPPYVLDPASLALTLGAFAAVALGLAAVAMLVSRRMRAARALRTVEEG